MEVHYRAYNLPTVTTLKKIATDLRLLPTGGTDYHGDRETYAEAHAQLWIPDEIAEGVRTALEVAVQPTAMTSQGSRKAEAAAAAACAPGSVLSEGLRWTGGGGQADRGGGEGGD